MKLISLFFFLAVAQVSYGQSKYKIEIITSNEKNAGTDDKIFFTLTGKVGSYTQHLDNKLIDDFERNTKSIFFTPTVSIGALTDIRVEIKKDKGDTRIDDIHIAKIVVTNTRTNKTTGKIDVNRWLGDGSDGKGDFKIYTKEIERWE